jgi:hypothetical protein
MEVEACVATVVLIGFIFWILSRWFRKERISNAQMPI